MTIVRARPGSVGGHLPKTLAERPWPPQPIVVEFGRIARNLAGLNAAIREAMPEAVRKLAGKRK